MCTIRVSNNLDPDQALCCIRPDLSPNCLQRLTLDYTSRQRFEKFNVIFMYYLCKHNDYCTVGLVLAHNVPLIFNIVTSHTCLLCICLCFIYLFHMLNMLKPGWTCISLIKVLSGSYCIYIQLVNPC